MKNLGAKLALAFVPLLAMATIWGCMEGPGKTGPMGPAGPAGSSNPTPNPTPTLIPLLSGTQTLNVWNMTGATINVLIDESAPSPSSVGPSSSVCQNETEQAYTVTTGGHKLTLSMDNSDAANWAFVNVTYDSDGDGFFPVPPVFSATSSVTVNVNIGSSYGNHGVFIGCYNTAIPSPTNSYAEVF